MTEASFHWAEPGSSFMKMILKMKDSGCLWVVMSSDMYSAVEQAAKTDEYANIIRCEPGEQVTIHGVKVLWHGWMPADRVWFVLKGGLEDATPNR